MKLYLSLITAAALTLAACGGESKPAAPAAPAASPAAEAPAAPASQAAPAPEASTPAAASAPAATASAECTTEITSDDAMKFDPKEITIKSSCTQYSIVLKHVGKMPKAAMGHNVVISKTADKDGILSDGAAAGAAGDFLKAGDSRVIAHTKLIGGGETDTVTFDVSKLTKGEAYEYFCSFPGHYAQMNGKLILAD